VIPEQELISRVIACDDHAAFGELVRRHHSAVRGFLRHLTHQNHALADDLAQETFVQAYRGLARFRGGSTFLTWVLGVAHNRWRNARRRPQFTVFTAAGDEPFVSDPTAASDLRADLAAALRALSPDEQLALHVCYQQGLTHEEAAALLDWPLGTVKTHVARGKEKLRQHLAVWNPHT
jgi:RNA polymerase sigma factor (sigma-70 family)